MYSQIVCPVCRNWTDSHNFCIRCGSRLGYTQMPHAPLALPYQPPGPVVQQGLGYPQMQAAMQPYSPYANWNTATTAPVQPPAYQPPAYQVSMPLAPAPYVHMQMMNQRMGLTTRPRF